MPKKNMKGFLFIAPSLIGLLVFYIFPFGINLSYCFRKIGDKAYSLENVVYNMKRVFSSFSFQVALRNNAIFLGIAIPFIIIISFLIAVMLRKATPINSFLRSAYFMPLVIPSAATIVVFQILFEKTGFINHVLSRMGLNDVDFFTGKYAMLTMVFIYIWKYCGYNIFLFIVGINAIPVEVFEAAKLDGASKFKTMYHITLKMISSTMFFVFIMSLINSFKIFREVYLLTGDYPPDNLYLLQHYLNNNFRNFNYQNLSVASLITFTFIIFVIAIIYLRKNRLGKED